MIFQKTSFIVTILSTVLLASCSSGNHSKMDWLFSSPNNDLKVSVCLEDGAVYYSVNKNDVEVVKSSKLGIKTNEISFENLSFINLNENKNISLKYENISGKCSSVDTVYNEYKLNFKQSDASFNIVFRLFNDGYGFQYEIASETLNSVTYNEELSEYNLPTNSMTYSMPYKENHDTATLPDPSDPNYEKEKNEPYYSYEGIYKKKSAKNFTSTTCAYPFLYSVSNTYSLLNEAGLIGSDYHGSMIQATPNNLKLIHSRACGSEVDLKMNLPFSSPWRVASIGTLAEVAESNIYENILGDVEYWKPDNYDSLSPEEKEIYNYDWVEPGTSYWSVLMYGGKYSNPFDYQADYEFQDHLVDVVEEMGWKWIVLDADWYFGEEHKSYIQRSGRQCPCEFSETRFKKFSSRTHEKGIKIFVWAHVFQSFYPENVMCSELDYYKSLGIDGVKIDFWDGLYDYDNSHKSKMESKGMVSYYEKFYQECAKRQMVVDCHGCNKPTSERRVYPNVISREAIYGSENKEHLSADNSVLLSLTRCVTGPSDFTPATKPLIKNTITTAHNMAICITMESGTQCLSAWDYEMFDQNTKQLTVAGEFYKNIPSTWDETKLVAANPDNYVIYARRSKDVWYVGGLNVNSGDYEVDLSFLDDKKYTCSVFKDENNDMISKETLDVSKNTKLLVNCKTNGGFAIIIK